jgi:hypothetical protein
MYADPDVAWPAASDGTRVLRAAVRKSDRTMHAAGGLGTTLDDLGRWLALQLGRGAVAGTRVLSEDATVATWELQADARDDGGMGPTEGFALGWERGTWRDQLELRHAGGYVGCTSYVCFLPELDLGLAVVATGGYGATALARVAMTDVHERLLADDQERDLLPQMRADARRARAREADAEEPAATPLPLALAPGRYAGTYRNEGYGTLVITEADGALRVRLGELPVALAAAGDGRVRFEVLGEVDGTFELAAGSDEVTAVVLDLDGPVRFVR